MSESKSTAEFIRKGQNTYHRNSNVLCAQFKKPFGALFGRNWQMTPYCRFVIEEERITETEPGEFDLCNVTVFVEVRN